MRPNQFLQRLLEQYLPGRTDRVRARRQIEQSPLDSAPAVPRGTVGNVVDEADALLWVDFGGEFGVVACDPRELEVVL